MKMKYIYCSLIICFILIIIGLFLLTHKNNKVWVHENGNIYCYDNKNILIKGWFEDDGYKYYSNEHGIVQTGWKHYEKDLYYFYSDGKMARDIFIEGKYLNDDGAWSNDIPSQPEVMYYKTVPVIVENTTKDAYYTAGHTFVVSVKVKSAEYNLEKTFQLKGSNMGGDPYSIEILNGQIKNGDTIYCEMDSWKSGDTVTKRELAHLVRN